MTSREYAEYRRLMELPVEEQTEETEDALGQILDWIDGDREDCPYFEGLQS
ncbi:hypothetical protein [Komagataeibacter xylinus]|uniref:hypothetical protein n=1 Tax=Komagataeibacter xylinus TaxID=28448 RepID=UPI00280BFB2E|nr:hypothetical protein [Komagataeibacter xylinus]